jgi:hypothetical protein
MPLRGSKWLVRSPPSYSTLLNELRTFVQKTFLAEYSRCPVSVSSSKHGHPKNQSIFLGRPHANHGFGISARIWSDILVRSPELVARRLLQCCRYVLQVRRAIRLWFDCRRVSLRKARALSSRLRSRVNSDASTASMLEVRGLNDCHEKETTSRKKSEGRSRPVAVHRHRDTVVGISDPLLFEPSPKRRK